MGFQFVRPDRLDEALRLIAPGDVWPVAGGTDFMVWLEEGAITPEKAVSLDGIAALKELTREEDTLRIGAAVTFTQLLKSGLLLPEHDALAQAARNTGGPQIRNIGTLGGNLCTASPAGDVSCALLALDASVELRSANETRVVPLDSYFLAPRKTVRRKDELLTAILLPMRGAGCSHFAKLGKRNALVIATANLAVSLELTGKTVSRVCIAAGSVAPTPLRLRKCEAFLLGKQLDEGILAQVNEMAAQEVSPIDDLRATASYRRKVSGNMLADSLKQLAEKGGC